MCRSAQEAFILAGWRHLGRRGAGVRVFVALVKRGTLATANQLLGMSNCRDFK